MCPTEMYVELARPVAVANMCATYVEVIYTQVCAFGMCDDGSISPCVFVFV